MVAALMARKVTIRLDDDLDAAVAASGVAVAELIRRGLTVKARAGRTAPLKAAAGVPLTRTGDPCPHPKTRVHKGLCGGCGTRVAS
jgi:hypothetical protein